ncbi:MAG: hypothetical protein QG638_1498, partial [Pseudomonadota bacterium]|nr:hypothetical protein [Pseudomonadota bacterium]
AVDHASLLAALATFTTFSTRQPQQFKDVRIEREHTRNMRYPGDVGIDGAGQEVKPVLRLGAQLPHAEALGSQITEESGQRQNQHDGRHTDALATNEGRGNS